MAEQSVSTTELRVYLRGLANRVAEDQERITVTRHGLLIGALVSVEDLEFLRKHKPHPTPHPVPDPEPCERDQLLQMLVDPAKMAPEEMDRLLDLTRDSTDWDVREWCARAMRVRWLRSKPPPETDPPQS